jgi:hypothetical protein
MNIEASLCQSQLVSFLKLGEVLLPISPLFSQLARFAPHLRQVLTLLDSN